MLSFFFFPALMGKAVEMVILSADNWAEVFVSLFVV